LRQIPEDTARQGVLRGAYVARHETGALELLLLATGSELHLALEAADKIGPGVRVVSMPCFERFDRQPPAYRDQVLPPGCDRRISIEAGVSQPWYKYVGRTGRVIGIDRFGLSAPGGSVLQALGISVETIVQTAGELSAAS
jgi:transketolase